MSTLRGWYEHCAELWKGRKRVDLTELAGSMDEALGAWPAEMGSRADAASHAQKLGVSNRTFGALKDAAPGTPEHKVHQFFKDAASYARRKSLRRPVVASGDSLTGEIDKQHLSHYAGLYANHHADIDFIDQRNKFEGRAKSSVQKPTGEVVAVRLRARRVSNRNALIGAAGHNPIHTMDDLDVLHAGAEHAIRSGAVSAPHANRYRVMREAMQRVSRTWSESYPNDKFEPSWGAMDTTALRVMRAGVDHLDAAGFTGAKSRYQPLLDAAISAHEKVPFRPRDQRKHAKNDTTSEYPYLHPIGSEAYWKQHSQLTADSARTDRRRKRQTQGVDAAAHVPAAVKTAKPSAPAASAPETASVKEPASYDEYKQRVEAGEKFEAGLTMKMERQRMLERRTRKSFAAHTFYKAWQTWRGERING